MSTQMTEKPLRRDTHEKMTLYLPATLIEAAKIAAVRRRTSVSGMVTDLLAADLCGSQASVSAAQDSASR